MPPAKKAKQERAPSAVIHVRNIPAHASEMDLVCTFSIYGPIKHILSLTSKRQALIEFENEQSSAGAMAAPALRVCGAGVDASYGGTGQLNPDGMSGIEISSTPSAVLIVAIEQCPFELPFHAIHRVLAAYGRVVRLIVLRKSTTQVLVEFESTVVARIACQALQNTAMLEGCGICRCNFSKNPSLSVPRDTADSRDFSRARRGSSVAAGGNLRQGRVGRVIVLQKLPPDVNCHHLVNLACLFGNVTTIRVLPKNPETAMIEFERSSGSQSFYKHCNDLPFLGTRLQLTVGDQQSINDTRSTPLSSGQPCCVNFKSDAHRRRYDNTKMQCTAPTAVLHYFNAPNTFQESHFKELCRRLQLPEPVKVSIKAGSTTLSGHLAFSSKAEAVDVVAKLNFVELRLPDGGLRTLKLSFSNMLVDSL
eukprot:m.36094 g.36094  ORF g.36094 m.36094 type:complete len:421 (-) comp12447_c0_seq4:182-1444(-)